MSDALKGILAVGALVLALTTVLAGRAPETVQPFEVDGARYRLDAAAARADGARELSAEARAAGLRFAPGVATGDQQVVLDAVASARPEARRLIELVDGLTTVSVGGTGAGSAGEARTGPEGFAVTLDLALVSTSLGDRGVRRLVLHELGHVVDFALLTDELVAALDAGVPRGWECEGGATGACAAVEERFAESFAKWAMGDIGVDLYIGYKVPPPGPTLDIWGEPLARLGA